MVEKGCLNMNPMILKGSLMVNASSFRRIQIIASKIIITSIVSILISPFVLLTHQEK
jgi:hypothetical protein